MIQLAWSQLYTLTDLMTWWFLSKKEYLNALLLDDGNTRDKL